MTARRLDALDPPACPLLGLALDARTHYSFAHPHHRCHAAEPPAPVGPQYQESYCLTPRFTACERYDSSLVPVNPPEPARPGR